MASDYPTILQIVPIPATSTKLQHTRVQGIVTSLVELGYDNLVCTYPHSKIITGAETLHTKSKRDNIRTHDQLAKTALSTNIRLLSLSIMAYKRCSPLAIHAHGFRGLSIGALVKICFFWKRTALICDLGEEECAKLSTKSRFGINALLIKTANVILCSTQDSLETTQQALNLTSTKAALVVNGINASTALSEKNIAAIRTKLRLDDDKTVVAINGGLEKHTDQLKKLQKVILKSKEAKENVHFLILGEPKKYLHAFLKKHQARDMCSFVGDVAPKLLPQYYSVCDIGLRLDRENTNESRTTVLNFMANALPIVTHETPLYRHCLPQNSLFANSTSSLIGNLKKLQESTELQEKLATQNVQRFEEFYSWEVSKEQLYATYMQALG